MALRLKVAPKNLYWVHAVILCPQDYEDIEESKFEVQFERFTRKEMEVFEREQRAINQFVGLSVIRKMEGDQKSAEALQALEAAYSETLDGLDEDFDPGKDFAFRWLSRKIKAFRGLLTIDDEEVTIDDLEDLLDIVSYRLGLINLLRDQLKDPNQADRKN